MIKKQKSHERRKKWCQSSGLKNTESHCPRWSSEFWLHLPFFSDLIANFWLTSQPQRLLPLHVVKSPVTRREHRQRTERSACWLGTTGQRQKTLVSGVIAICMTPYYFTEDSEFNIIQSTSSNPTFRVSMKGGEYKVCI